MFAGARPRPRRLVDLSILVTLTGIALQLVPLPPSIVETLAPAASAFRAAMDLDARPGAWTPLTLDRDATIVHLALAASAAALFFAARAVAGSDGRALARWVGWMALLAAVIGIGRHTLFPSGLIYGFWEPQQPGAVPFGVIINRNHYAAWAVVAAALTAGGVIAHVSRLSSRVPATRRMAALGGDARTMWLFFAVAVIAASVIVTASRAGFIGLLGALAVFVALAWRRMGARALAAATVIGLACATATLLWARPENLLTRIGDTVAAPGTRTEIWRASAGIAARYPMTGVGAGAYPAAMTHYQTRRDVFFNHAHNQYLEIAAEGGLLLGLPVALILTGLVSAVRRGVAADGGSYFWLRAGAAAGLAGLALLSIWESPFRTPVTLMAAAVAAGLAAASPQR